VPITPREFADRGRRRAASLGIDPARLPPGQSPTLKWPVLSLDETPRVDAAEWRLSIDGAVRRPYTLDWGEFEHVAGAEWTGDIHCVTRWSKFGMQWQGASVAELIAAAEPREQASHLLAHSYGGYTTNMSLSDVVDHPALIAHRVDDEPLEPDHGGPARLLVPHLYLWKSAKWIRRLQVLDSDQLGFWERNGYHHRGDPWKEERHSVDDYVARAMRNRIRREAR
jgi:DMSO/TMAO reductase YedYZ molybdopterin-dependent catalytic subunit